MKIIENAGKIVLRPQVIYGFKETHFHRIHSYSEKYFGCFMYIVCTKSNENDRKWGKNYFTTYGTNYNEFHESYTYRMTSLGDLTPNFPQVSQAVRNIQIEIR